MSEQSRASIPPESHNKEEPDYFGFYKHEIAELLSQDEDFLPFSSQGPEISGEERDNSFRNSSSLFSNGLGAGLSDYKREKLKGLLRQSANVLTQQVDEMVDPVMATCRLRYCLRKKKHMLNSSDAAGDGDGEIPFRKKLKNSSSSSSISVPAHAGSVKSGSRQISDKSCAHCHTSETSQWRNSPGGRKLCNACGIRLKKEGKLLSMESDEMEFLWGPQEGVEKENELSEDMKFLLESDSAQVEAIIKKYSDEMSASLELMEQQFEELLDSLMTNCRPMTMAEKLQLGKLIQKLSPKNLDRVTEIVRRSKPQSGVGNEIFVNLLEEDNKTLWRLYYYVEAVEIARRNLDQTKTKP